jgi:hypothetical protein
MPKMLKSAPAMTVLRSDFEVTDGRVLSGTPTVRIARRVEARPVLVERVVLPRWHGPGNVTRDSSNCCPDLTRFTRD